MRDSFCEIQIVHQMLMTQRKELGADAVHGRMRNGAELLEYINCESEELEKQRALV